MLNHTLFKRAISSLMFAVIFLLSSHSSYCQNFEFIPDSNAYWTINGSTFNASVPYHPYGVMGDTIIESNVYHQIHQSNDSIWNPQNTTYFCAARQDQDKWLFVQKGDTTQYLLYDFDVSIGDTILLTNPWTTQTGLEVEVVSIDSALVQGVYKARIGIGYFFGNYTEYWVEGMGSYHGLIYSGFVSFEFDYQLICFHKDDTLQYMNSPNGSCYYQNGLGVDDLYSDGNVYVFPNPSNGIVSLELDNLKNVEIKVYALNGQLLFVDNNVNSPNYQFEFDQPAGVYFVKVNSENYTKSLKLIIE
jgi:hypothetical protein